MSDPVLLIANGDLRLSANRVCWPAQQQAEEAVTAAIENLGHKVRRGHPVDPVKGHGFIDSQRYGMEVFRQLPTEAPLVVVDAVWQYSHQVLHGLYTHQGPILTVANWSGQWPGLVGLLNLNGSLRKAGVRYSTLWSKDFTDEFFLGGLKKWLEGEAVTHDTSHARPLGECRLPEGARELGMRLAQELRRNKAIMGVFDEGCMGMYNAIIPDELLHPTGVFKERLSQSALYAGMLRVSDEEARAVRAWLDGRGMRFHVGSDEATELTEAQIHEQCRMYVAALRIADEYGCDTIGIQYQQGLKDLCAASDLVEGLLNNPDRPPVTANGRVLYEGRALPHFNEVDECAGLDGLVTDRVWRAMGLDPSNTLHDVRYGEEYDGRFVWVLEISGAAPASHFTGGYAGTVSERQPAMYFPKGGGSMKGVSRPGEIVWSRVYVAEGKLQADLGRAGVVELPAEETERRWQMTTPQWPIMHAVTYGVSRDQMMARHASNHIQVVYAPDGEKANEALAAKAAMFAGLGLDVHICGSNHGLGC
ncbi:MAG: fucose isomerase [Bryobacteraceae bacterium]|nr:fucose isomerase [Bryobacteraceae bacterium]